MSMIVRHPGVRSWLVDGGRASARALGVPLGGAADRASLQLGNALVGNDPWAVGLELTLSGPTLYAEHSTACVVFGAPFDLRRNGTGELLPGTTFTLNAGDTLRIGGTPAGCRAYLCVTGGFESPLMMGSRSAWKAVESGQRLECPESRIGGRGLGFVNLLEQATPPGSLRSPPSPKRRGLENDTPPLRLGEGAGGWGDFSLRALPGTQTDWFVDNTFWESEYRLAPASDRMGLRLLGPTLAKRDAEMVSEAVAPGAVQVANDGLPIVLGVDGQTIGGYPKVAHVIVADLDLLAQLRPGDAVRFQQVNLEEAEQLATNRRKEIANWSMRLQATATITFA